jgi:D-erythro-7,8-dihydroneopterin triphosphate epimerase
MAECLIMKTATIRISDLLIRTIIGGNDWERNALQDVIVTIEMTYDVQKAIATDSMDDVLDYKKLKRKIISEVEKSRFNLLESLTSCVLGLVMADERVQNASVKIEKPGALRFAKTVSVEMSDRRNS